VSPTIAVINLDRSPDRLAEFARCNHDVVCWERSAGVDGRLVSREDLLRTGILAPQNHYVAGAVGCALSHLKLWKRAILENKPITICEDDAIFNRKFSVLASYLINICKLDFDIIFWGWNPESPILFDLFPGGVRCAAVSTREEIAKSIDVFRTAELYPSLHRVYEIYGLICYTVSAKGARALVDRLFPLGSGTTFSNALNRPVDNIGIDVAMNVVHPELWSLICFPPLVVSSNEPDRSTIGRTHEDRLGRPRRG
jgi:hypothetical protein